MPYKIPSKGLCDLINEDTYFYHELVEVSDYKLPSPCPIPSQIYEIRGWTPSLKNVPKSIMPSGEYKVELKYTKKEKVLVHLLLFASIVNIS